MATTYTLISSQVLSSAAASVTFSSIPSTYTDLKLVCSARGDNGGLIFEIVKLVFNSDTGTNYSYRSIQSDGSTPSSAFNSSNANAFLQFGVAGSTSTASTFGSMEVYIPNYTLTGTKQIYEFGVGENNATASRLAQNASYYRGTAAITSISLSLYYSTNFVSGSSFYLYGIKNS